MLKKLLLCFLLCCSLSSCDNRNSSPDSSSYEVVNEPAGAEAEALYDRIAKHGQIIADPAGGGEGSSQARQEAEAARNTHLLLAKYASQQSMAILTFGLLLTALQVVVILKKEKGWNDNCIKLMGLTLVITTGCFLISAGYSQSQIAPMIGLLGTIAGYLLGKVETTHRHEKPA